MFFPVNLNQAETVKPAIDCAQGAQILTKGAVNFHGEQQEKEQYSQLPQKQSADLTAKGLVGSQQRDGAKQCARGADVFAKCRYLGESAEQKNRANAREEKQNRVLTVF